MSGGYVRLLSKSRHLGEQAAMLATEPRSQRACDNALRRFVRQNGVVSGAPFLSLFVVQTSTGIAIDVLVRRTQVSRTAVKKIAVISGIVYTILKCFVVGMVW